MIRKIFMIILPLCIISCSGETKYKVVAQDNSSVKVRLTTRLEDRLLTMSVNPIPGLSIGQAAFVKELKVTNDQGQQVEVRDLGLRGSQYSWEVVGIDNGSDVSISYVIELDHQEYNWPFGIEEVAYKFEEGVFFTGRSLFLIANKSDPIEVIFQLPENWKSSTPWDSKGKNSYTVNSVSDLINNCFVLGTHNEYSYVVKDLTLKLAMGKDVIEAKPLFEKWLSASMESMAAIFDGPLSNSYLVVLNRAGRNEGGAFNSSFSIITDGEVTDNSMSVLGHGLIHETLHLWNGIAMRSSQQLEWFSEGFTDYLTIRELVKNELISEEILFKKLENVYRRYVLAKLMMGSKVSLKEAGNNKRENLFLVYAGGTLLALALDIEMRQAGNGEIGLENLMARLFSAYGNKSASFSEIEMIVIIEELTGENMKPLFDKYLTGNEFFDFKKYIDKCGLEMYNMMDEIFIFRQKETSVAQQKMGKIIFNL